ncbi:ABC transporter permease [Jiangella alkaliphila]|uniref:Oligopeptide transport system permease protein n=1 Tax=Jiangella alkaliphila TaxID=419479 RepID=A0A1H2JD34_9ACTN|nr:ABC transporter permease [Jiangella alkaliphila]SDU54071.1 oligopeptide transport system permease protein [Jiangella alkaliphila]
MGRYVARRMLQMIPVVIGTTFIIYALVWALPGDPFAGRCGARPCPAAYVAEMTDKYNLDDPLPIAYVKYLGNLIRGDFGETFQGLSVAEELVRAYPTTLKLALVAIVFEILIGIGAGIMAGLRRGSFIDNLVLVSTLVVVSIPVFVIGSVLQLFLGMRWGIFPATVGGDASLYNLILPGFVLASLSLAYVARLTRTSLAENRRADYVRTAVAKGLPQRRVIGIHTMRNSLIPVITFIGADFGALLGGAIVTEGIFNVPGVGNLIFRSITSRDGVMVTGAVTVLVLVFLLVNLLVDLIYGWLDPRISHG